MSSQDEEKSLSSSSSEESIQRGLFSKIEEDLQSPFVRSAVRRSVGELGTGSTETQLEEEFGAGLFDTTELAEELQRDIDRLTALIAEQSDSGNDTEAVTSQEEQISRMATSTMFENTPIATTELSNLMVMVKRQDRGSNTKDRLKVQASATEAISPKFGLPVYFVNNASGEAEEGNLTSNKVEEVFTSNAHKTNAFELRCQQYDMMETLNIPALVNAAGTNPNERWDLNTKKNLLRHFGSIDLDTVKTWQSDMLLWGKEYQKEDQKWLLELARKSCTTELKQKVERLFTKLEPQYQGGIVFIKLIFNNIILMNDNVVTALQKYIKSFRDNGLLKYSGENVDTAQVEMTAIATRLSEVGQLPSDAVDDVLEGLKKCSHEEFKNTFSQFKTLKKQTLLNVGGLTGSTLENIETIFEQASSLFTEYCLAEEWNYGDSKQKGYVNSCFNCGGDHGVRKCPRPIDEAKVERNRKAFQEKRNNNPNSNSKSNSKSSSTTSKNGYGRGKFGAPKSGESVRTVKGTVYCACKHGCGWNKTHTSNYHEKWVADKANFTLPDSHPFMKKKAEVYATRSNTSNNTSNNNGNGNNSGSQASHVTNNGGTVNSTQTSGNPQQANFTRIYNNLERLERDAQNPDHSQLMSLLKMAFDPLNF